MPFTYDPAGTAELRQGELLGRTTELRTRNAADAVDGADPIVDKRPHERILVVTADCDLLKDYLNRQPGEEQKTAHLVEHVLVCDVYTVEELAGITPTTFSSREMRRIAGNQDERYHRFPPAVIQGAESELPEFYLDFKRCFGLPPEALYDQLSAGQADRLARLPAVFLQDLIHRFYNFLSRVGPDFE